MKVSIILLNWNGGADTLACLESLRHVSYRPFDIVIVDNGSHDGSPDRIQAAHPDIPLLRQPRNVGFAEGNNIGMRYALAHGADYVLLLNNDTEVAPDVLDHLVAAATAHPQAGFLGPKIYYHSDPQRIWMGMPLWDAQACRFTHLGLNQLDEEAGLKETRDAAFACGCALMASRQVIDAVGLIDPRFFIYFEEVDWCFRGARAGFSSLYVPDAHVWHKVSRTMGGKMTPVPCYLRTRNSLLWAERTLTPRQRWRVFRDRARDLHAHLTWRTPDIRDTPRRWYWNVLTMHRDPCFKAWRRGLLDYLRRRFGEPPEAIRRLPKTRAIPTPASPPAGT